MNETTLLLLIAAGINGAGMGIGASGFFWWVSRRQDATIHRMQAEHENTLAQREQEHQRKQADLKAKIDRLQSQVDLLVGMLRGRNVITADDAVRISNGAGDPLYTALRSWFDLNELETVARDAGIEYENVGGETREQVAGRMVEYARRHDLYDKLARVVREARPGQVSA